MYQKIKNDKICENFHRLPLTLGQTKNVTVDTFACLSMCNTMTLLFLPFKIVDFWGSRNDPLMTFDPNEKKALYKALSEHPSD